MLDRNTKAAYLLDVAISNSHSLYSSIMEKLQKYTDLTEEIANIWHLNAIYVLALPTKSTIHKNYITS